MSERLEKTKAAGEACIGNRPSAYDDDRFGRVLDLSGQINAMAGDMNTMAHRKLGELIGDMPRDPACETKGVDPSSWIDRVLYEQELAINTLRDTMERISSI